VSIINKAVIPARSYGAGECPVCSLPQRAHSPSSISRVSSAIMSRSFARPYGSKRSRASSLWQWRLSALEDGIARGRYGNVLPRSAKHVFCDGPSLTRPMPAIVFLRRTPIGHHRLERTQRIFKLNPATRPRLAGFLHAFFSLSPRCVCYRRRITVVSIQDNREITSRRDTAGW